MTVAFAEPGKTLRQLAGLGSRQGGPARRDGNSTGAAERGGTNITLHYRVGGYSRDALGEFAPVVDRVQGMQLEGLAGYLRRAAAP